MKITPEQLRALIIEESARLDEAAASAHDAVVSAVEIYQRKGMRLEELQDAIRATWMAARRAAQAPRSAAQKAATAKKSAATREANKRLAAMGSSWKDTMARLEAALQQNLTPSQIKRYRKIEQDVALSGAKEGGSPASILAQMGMSDDVIDRVVTAAYGKR